MKSGLIADPQRKIIEKYNWTKNSHELSIERTKTKLNVRLCFQALEHFYRITKEKS